MQKLPVVFAIDRGGLLARMAPPSGLLDYSYLRSIPNIIVMAPKMKTNCAALLKTAIGCGIPVVVALPRGKGVGVSWMEELKTLEIGKAKCCERVRSAVIAIGSTVLSGLAAVKRPLRRRI